MSQRSHWMKTLVSALLLASWQISLSYAKSETTSGTLSCTPACAAGYECVAGVCTQLQCTQDCTDANSGVVCGSNNVTYSNECELQKAKCRLSQDITVRHRGECVGKLCSKHQTEFDNYTLEKYKIKCNIDGVMAKSQNKTLQYSDVANCYRPQCNFSTDGSHYLLKQCSYLSSNWCWCSTPGGSVIPNTFQSNMPTAFCSSFQNIETCEDGGLSYHNGDIFTSRSICGLCECMSGTSTCFLNFTFDDASDQLNSEHLQTLKQKLIQTYHYQYTTSNSTAEIRKHLKNPLEVSDTAKDAALLWKFNQYDKNKDDRLYSGEVFVVRKDLLELFGSECWRFDLDQLSQLLDKDSDGYVTMDEWNSFFGTTSVSHSTTEALGDQLSQPVKRDASLSTLRKPLHLRKKFKYVIV